ncbi:hypothetical protein ACFL0W_01705 [Nanoarchaeota archaeon]
MEKEKTKICMKVELPAFTAELETFAEKGAIEDKMIELLDAIEKSRNKIEKIFGKVAKKADVSEPSSTQSKPQHPYEHMSEPVTNISRKLGISAEKLIGSSVFGFKDDKPQLFDSTKFKSSNTATRCLIYLFEIGLSKTSISLEELKESYSLSKIKGRSVSQIVNDLVKTSQIDVGRYKKSKEIVLTAKGQTDAENELKFILTE